MNTRQPWVFRPATEDDAGGILAIYAPYIRESLITFEEKVPPEAAFRERIGRIIAEYPYLVAVRGGRIAGYAYASRHAERAAYRYSVNTSIYLAPEFQRMGLGRELYGRLLTAAAERGFHRAFAGITVPNPASMALHRALGFREIGVFHEAGFKFDRWLDVVWFEKNLSL